MIALRSGCEFPVAEHESGNYSCTKNILRLGLVTFQYRRTDQSMVCDGLYPIVEDLIIRNSGS